MQSILYSKNCCPSIVFSILENGVASSSDFYLRLVNDAGRMLKGTTPYTRSHPTEHMYGRVVLTTNQKLSADQKLFSNNGQFYLLMQTDGNLVVYNASNKPVWATNTLGKGGTYVIIQGSDGNLVLYTSSDSPVWSSNTAGTGANNLVLNDD